MNPLTRRALRLAAGLSIFLTVLSPPRIGSADAGPTMLAGIPTLKQQHELTCEASAASMGTRGVLPESQIMAVMPRNANPNVGFRGNPDAIPDRALLNYGVYAAPVQRALATYGYRSTLLTYATRADIKSSINRGWPVVAWITYQLRPEKPRLGVHNGVHFILVPFEHAVTIIGYDSQSVIANDPWTKKQVRYNWPDFERSWGLFGNMALSMESCPFPAQVKRIRLAAVASSGLIWSWTAAKNAAQYDVTVTKHAASDKVVFRGLVADSRFTLASPTPGVSYEIAVKSVSSCGGTSVATRQWFTVPAMLPTPTPTEGQGTITPPKPTATPSPTPSR